ncbi:MAG: HD domain-containing phosphohydrolase [Burkholderiales bacterium]
MSPTSPSQHSTTSGKTTVLIVDDQSTSRAILGQVVSNIDREVEVVSFAQPLEAIAWSVSNTADLVFVDYRMPDLDGIEFVNRLRKLSAFEHVPIVMVTVFDDRRLRYLALDAGVTDFLTKPFDTRECMARCRNLLILRRQQLALEDRGRQLEGLVRDATRDVRERERETLLRLAKAGEFRDAETGNHVLRMSHYSRLIAETLGMPGDDVESIEVAAPLHDIGKIGVPDHILRKSGGLNFEETKIMQQHPVIGYEILKNSASKYVRMGALIALGHHEKFDGTGYPHRLIGDHIPLPARIVAIADVYDALTTMRPYKKAWESDAAFAYILDHRSTHFDPALVEKFVGVRGQIIEIQHELQDSEPESFESREPDTL